MIIQLLRLDSGKELLESLELLDTRDEAEAVADSNHRLPRCLRIPAYNAFTANLRNIHRVNA